MKYLVIVGIVSLGIACGGCQGKQEYTVDKNDPGSVENASKVEPVPMRSDGTPLNPNGQPVPPAKQ